MASRRVYIQNKLGLHARASARLVSTASRYSSEIMLAKDDIEVNAKSIMGIMMLAAGKGSDLILSADGSDADEALDAIEQLINDHFGEEG